MEEISDMGKKFTVNVPCGEYMMNIGHVSKMLGLHKECIRKMMASGVIPAIKIGNKWSIDRDTFNNWLSGLYNARYNSVQVSKTATGKGDRNGGPKVGKIADPAGDGGCQSQTSSLKTVEGNIFTHELEK